MLKGGCNQTKLDLPSANEVIKAIAEYTISAFMEAAAPNVIYVSFEPFKKHFNALLLCPIAKLIRN